MTLPADPLRGPALATRLRARGRGMIGAGIVLVVAFVLTVANAGYGSDPNRELAERRSYNMVKVSVHETVLESWPYLAGALLLFTFGRRHLRRAEALDPPAAD